MNKKTRQVLEYPKILKKVAEHTSFSAGHKLALESEPSNDLRLARQWLAETSEARRLLDENTRVHLGGVFDVRPLLPQAERGSLLLPPDLLEIRSTLMRARSLQDILTRQEQRFPNLADISFRMEPVPHVIKQIGQVVDERGDLLDSASPTLARLRSQIKVVQGRLTERLNRMVSSSDTVKYLQEAIVTQRQGRYVVPVKAEFKGRIRGLIHDQSSSGATLFIEPFAVVELNNEWRKLQLDEQDEVRRLLAELTDLVAEESPYIRQTVEALALLDLIFARARYSNDLNATLPELVPFSDKLRQTAKNPTDQTSSPARHPGSVIDLKRARHPLLDPETVVPIDVYIDDDFFVLLITGPNTGGKTVTLKTVGLLALMAQSGLHIPADEGSSISCFHTIFADIGDEQSIEQSLSTFSSHMTNIIAILAKADEQSLVLLDELGAGTDPEEGSALARALLDHLVQQRITTLATTHYSELKVYAHSTPGVRNANVEFDLKSLAPTFELSIGLPGRSNALAIATRLGLDRAITSAAETLVRPESLEADSLLQEIKETRLSLEAERAQAEAVRRQTESQEKELRYRLSQIEEARRQVLNEAREQAQEELAELSGEIGNLRRQLTGASAGGSASTHQQLLEEAKRVLAERQRAAEQVPEEVEEAIPTAISELPLSVGDTVWIPSLQASGQIVTLAEDENEAELQIGSFRLRLPLDRLERRDVSKAAAAGISMPQMLPGSSVGSSGPSPSVGIELDIRGASVAEMLPRLEKYLDDAYLAMKPWVRVIHGKGTGVLRTAVRRELSKHPLVTRFREGESGEGGDGVTVAYLVGQ
ncbi:MAG: endonuclease MutS2 [Chloroflexota bacterium]|nr:endonuclease MutS2 [Chloroflexota bacterium]